MSGRRRFIAEAGTLLAAVGASAAVDAPNVIAQPKIRWRMPATVPAALDVPFGAIQRFAALVDELSGGRFQVEVFPAGQIMPPLACFDETSKGTVEAFRGTSYNWAHKEPAVQWFATVPFGMNTEGMAAWYFQGGGLKLWEETYAAFDLVPRPGNPTGPQMAGWFRRKIHSVADYKGLKMRIPGLGGKVVARAGGTVVLIPSGEVYSALERGVIDASEFTSPYDDMKLGLQSTARYYYYPGWHEPGTTNEFVFNKKAYEGLPADLRRILDHAAAAAGVYTLSEYAVKNAVALQRLKTEFKGKVEVLPLPASVLRDLKKLAGQVVREESEKSPMAGKVYASFTKFEALVGSWDHVAEGAYHQLIAG